MSLNIALNSAVSSLLTIEQQMAVTSSNISNANTTGYTKKSVEVTTQVTNGLGGAKAGAITAKVNTYLLKDIIRQASVMAAASTNYDYYQSLVQDLGSVSSGTSSGSDLSSALTSLASSLSNLETTPDSSSNKAQVVSDLDTVASALREASANIQSLRTQADGEISSTIDEVNTQVDTISSLNAAIVAAKASGQSTADLEDSRNTALNTLATDINVSYFVDNTGAMRVYTGSGQSLIDETGGVHHLSHDTASSLSSTVTYASGGIDGIHLGAGDITTQVSSGKLGALINQRDTVLVNAQAELDNLASSLATALNAASNLGTANVPQNSLTGSAGVASSDAVTVAGGTTIRIALTDSSGKVTATQDIDISAAATVADVMTDLQSLSGVSASISNGHLVLAASGSGSGIAVTTLSGSIGGTCLSSYFGLNDVVGNGSSAATFSVRSDILSSSSLLPTGSLGSAATLAVGGSAVSASGITAVSAMAGAMSASRSFSASGTLGATTSTYSGYASSIISGLSTASSSAKQTATTTGTTFTTLTSQFSSQSGVNSDEESATLVSLENNYAASAKVVSTVKTMFEALLAAVSA